MDSTLNRASLRWGAPGLILQSLAALVVLNSHVPVIDFLALLGAVAGEIMWLVGLGYYARAKDHSQWWGLVGFLSIIGLAVLVFLPDRLKPRQDFLATDEVDIADGTQPPLGGN